MAIIEPSNEKFVKLCEVVGLTKGQIDTCKSLEVSCKNPGFIEVNVEYYATYAFEEINHDKQN